ncbi:MAG TPA: 2-octaprenyl-6-methoxyphenyl hydroxylase [Gammaproteobacteria bacterium]|nr:2-octaprenyl-6-methoxyphenyl hydroxylase [Gammaproteobacteria bacterium]
MTGEQTGLFDLIIIGGGLAGASLACALRGQGLKIAVVEAYEINTQEQPCYDERTVALSYGSRVIFDSMGVWDRLSDCAEPIDTIHISDRGHFGVTRLTKEQEGVEALGYVLENLCIGQQLYKLMREQDDISLFCPAQLLELKQAAQQVSVDISIDGKTQKLSGRLLVAADGNRSQVLQMLAIGSSRQDYGQSALICNVTPAKKHHNVAYERFTDSGPLAFLPMKDNRCSVVWTLEPEQAEYLYALEDEDFRALLQQRFGYRLGMIQKTGKRAVYPLFMQAATQMSHRRVAIIGNAAHSVHPVAGQGFNLALRDVALLAELVVEAGRSGQDIGADILLQQYVNTREQDIQRVYRFTDVLVKTFSNAIEPLAHLRSCALQLVDMVPELKHQLGRQSMGLAGRLPRLGRGLPL